MFSLVAGRAQRRGRADEPIRTQLDRSRSRDQQIASTKHRSVKESDSSNNCAPIVVGPLTTNQDLEAKGEKVFNLPLMIQQPFLREKKEPIKVDISVKLIPKARKREKKRRELQVEEITVHTDDNKGVKNSFSMEVTDDSVQVLKHDVETIEAQNNMTQNDHQEPTIKETEILVEKLDIESTEATVKIEDIPDVQEADIENVEVDTTNREFQQNSGNTTNENPPTDPIQNPDIDGQNIKSNDTEPMKETEDSKIKVLEEIENIEDTETDAPTSEAQLINENIELEAS